MYPLDVGQVLFYSHRHAIRILDNRRKRALIGKKTEEQWQKKLTPSLDRFITPALETSTTYGAKLDRTTSGSVQCLRGEASCCTNHEAKVLSFLAELLFAGSGVCEAD